MAGEFADLISQNQLGRVTVAITKTIMASFKSHPPRDAITQALVKERFRTLEDGFRMMRGDLKWSVDRCCDNLAEFMRCKLDGVAWTVPKRVCWMPGNDK